MIRKLVLLLFCATAFACVDAQPRARSGSVRVSTSFALVPPAQVPYAIIYERDRPLTLDDFQGEPNDPQAVAATYSSLGLGYRATTRNGVVDLVITITCYMDPQKSWCRPNARTKRVLDHEQLHFDITALAACNLQEAIAAATFTPGNYKSELARIQQQWNDWWRAKEEQYDSETAHGTIRERQSAWADAIREQIELQPCFLSAGESAGD